MPTKKPAAVNTAYLDAIEDFIMDEDDEDDNDEEGAYQFVDPWEDEDEEEPEEGYDFGDEESTVYEVICPTCGKANAFDESVLEKGSITCERCGETLEFSLEDDEEPEDEEGISF